MKPRIVITAGDPSGIGPEVVAKAIRDPRVLEACDPIIVGDPASFALHGQPLPQVEMLSVPGENKKITLGKPSREAGLAAIESVKLAAGLIQTRQASALVTAPASKTSFMLAGLKYPGHTEWLMKEFGEGQGAMLMVAGELRAILMTRHLPLAAVSAHLDLETIICAGTYGFEFVKHTLKKLRPKVALCGLNPHAGDGGLIGQEEKKIFRPAVKQLKSRGISVRGPLPADSVFRDMAAGRYDLVLAAYHDQGMIPLKLHAADRLVNITLGLPFIRTSPGHGTAHDIAGKNRADPRPTIEAIRLAALYSR